MNEDTINVQIGNDSPVVYHIRQTWAPKAYDGFGTIEMMNIGGEFGRIVLIRDEHFTWQSQRYSSGMFTCSTPDGIDSGDIQQALWRRLLGKEDA
jgi:hypothetical protein